jgi:uncharacterized protein with FMN-binding domain
LRESSFIVILFLLLFSFFMSQQKNPTQKWVTLIIIILLLGGLVAFMMSEREEHAVIQDQSLVKTTAVVFKDGTYRALGDYASPGGSESIDVTLTLKENLITSVVVTPKAENPASKNWQTRFISGVENVVVGKKISEINLNEVSGSSLTPIGFMNALEKIKLEAGA